MPRFVRLAALDSGSLDAASKHCSSARSLLLRAGEFDRVSEVDALEQRVGQAKVRLSAEADCKRHLGEVEAAIGRGEAVFARARLEFAR